MKKHVRIILQAVVVFFCLIISSLQPLSVQAQISIEENYTGFFPPADADAPQRMHRWMFNFNRVDWLDAPKGVKLEPWSFGFDFFRFIEYPNAKSTFSLAFGGGFGFFHFHNNAAVTVIVDSLTQDEFTTFVPFDPSYEYKYHKLVLNYFDGAFQLRFRSNKKNNVFFYPGFKFGFLFNNHTKTIDNESKIKVYNMKNISRFRVGPMIHLGINHWGITGFYSITPLFEETKGERMPVFSVGVTFNLF